MGLKKQLDAPYDIDVTIVAISINSITIDPANNLVHLGYSTLQAGGIAFQAHFPLTLSDQDYTDFLARTNELGNTMIAREAQFQAALEYSPGAGTISGRIKTLTTHYDISGTVMGQDVDGYAFNDDDRLIHIVYSELNSPTSSLVTHRPWTLSGVEYDEFMNRMDFLAETMTVTQAEIATCLEFLPGDGTIVNV